MRSAYKIIDENIELKDRLGDEITIAMVLHEIQLSQTEAYNEAIGDASEKAQVNASGNWTGTKQKVMVDKQSILSLLKK